ncbi:MAG: hypothetical protein JRF50_07910 [Deltaproteobacteria bacterium]|nr:hypothetical protein [Deltaproteobacteria bacterium]
MDMRAIRWAVLILAIMWLLSIAPLKAEAEDDCGSIADKISHGEILWTENAIIVQGTAAPNLSDPDKPVSAIKREAQRAATLDAYTKVAGILAGISVTSDTLAADSPEVISRIEAYVQHSKICKAKYYADGGVDIVVKVPLTGELAKALLPLAGSNVATSKSEFTGLVVDASDLPFAPALAPRLLDPSGSVLFSQGSVRVEVIEKQGAVKYVQSPRAVNKDFVGTKPLKIKAVGLGSLSPTDLVVDQKAASVLSRSPAFLGDGKVIIIIPLIQRLKCKDLAAKAKDRLVDWERRIVLVRGTGKVNFTNKWDNAVRLRMMERAAEVDAQRGLLETLLQIRVDGSKALKDEPRAPQYIKGVVRNSVRCSAKYFRDGTAEVVLAAPIDSMATEVANLGKQRGPTLTVSKIDATGLIIDASGLKFKPILAPKLLGPDGTEIYGPDIVAKAYVHQYGVAGYSSSVDEAMSDKRTGQRPIIVDAEKVADDPSHLVLAAKDMNKLGQLKDIVGLLSQGRVIIVTEHAANK